MLRRLLLPTAVLGALALPGAASAADWSPADSATVRPGSLTTTAGSGRCTANFVFTNGSDVLIGQAAHCAGTGGATETDGCTATSRPLGTKVDVEGAAHSGELVYSSWLRMQGRGEQDASTCAANDFALVKLDARDVAKVNPSVPFWGGPTALAPLQGSGSGAVHSYGNSPLRAGLETLKPKVGLEVSQDNDGWSHSVFTLTPGVPGDSGSAFLDASGRALGTLSTLNLAPLPLSNGVSDLPRELAYAQAAPGFSKLSLAVGTEPFRASDPARTVRELQRRVTKDLGSVLDGSFLMRALGAI